MESVGASIEVQTRLPLAMKLVKIQGIARWRQRL
jgi:hypothetical protein